MLVSWQARYFGPADAGLRGRRQTLRKSSLLCVAHILALTHCLNLRSLTLNHSDSRSLNFHSLNFNHSHSHSLSLRIILLNFNHSKISCHRHPAAHPCPKGAGRKGAQFCAVERGSEGKPKSCQSQKAQLCLAALRWLRCSRQKPHYPYYPSSSPRAAKKRS